jgi:hypothetical protein
MTELLNFTRQDPAGNKVKGRIWIRITMVSFHNTDESYILVILAG